MAPLDPSINRKGKVALNQERTNFPHQTHNIRIENPATLKDQSRSDNPFQLAFEATEETKELEDLNSMITPIATFKSLKIDSNACL